MSKRMVLFPRVTTFALLVLICGVSSFSVPKVSVNKAAVTSLQASVETNNDMFFATSEGQGDAERRAMGSQELLMLPRQYGPGDSDFPQMNHVSCTVLSATPAEETLRAAIDEAIRSHPLLRAYVEGDGEPDERIDLFQMVRKGEPNPCTFVAPSTAQISSQDVLSVVEVEGSDREALYKSWQTNFNYDLDNGEWCDPEKGPLWKVTLHRTNGGDGPCALLFSFNHAISDQSSANMLADQIIANIAQIEENGQVTTLAKSQEMPVALEDSVMGNKQRFSDVTVEGFSPQTVAYVAGKAAEGFKSPVIVPDSESNGKDGAGGLLGALTIISGNAAGGEDDENAVRTSTLQFRKLSKEATTALLEKCREKGVAVTNALTAATALASTDCIDNGMENGQTRNYKVLQSLDMRRFGEKMDQGDTVACMAGSMDLMHGPLKDRAGESFRSNPTEAKMNQFWDLAKEGRTQTADFIDNEGPRQAVRVFDFAMTISDMNNLVDLTAKSKDSQGRAYSAGVSNVGVYDRQKAVQREGSNERDNLKVSQPIEL